MALRVKYLITLAVALLLCSACEPQARYQSRASEVFPPVAIKYAALFRLNQAPISPAFFNGQWTALAFAAAACDADCQHRLALLNDVNAAQTLLVIDDLASPQRLTALKQTYPAVAISMGTTAASIDNFMRQFDAEPDPQADNKAFIYLVNPRPEFAYTLAVKDLKPGDIDKELAYLKTNFNNE